ncbi:pre-mRNA-splicing factor CWC25 homolog [Oenanthe melanoleuca]|uniref:pre-mRNA-splicing factor CWC25 homolog n=1 Tax=Oenanthe melanoleuca TaxID=2939378 RepID=UPI0024C1863C|nr:pre-mRNA-splicing factor CWC25 homolog [Oenanthe melanoleuca]
MSQVPSLGDNAICVSPGSSVSRSVPQGQNPAPAQVSPSGGHVPHVAVPVSPCPQRRVRAASRNFYERGLIPGDVPECPQPSGPPTPFPPERDGVTGVAQGTPRPSGGTHAWVFGGRGGGARRGQKKGNSSFAKFTTFLFIPPLIFIFYFCFRKREEEKKREVLNNPVKMKKIKALLQNSLDKKERKKKKEKKKKHKKHRRRSSSSSSSSSGEERGRNKSQKKVESSSWKAAPSKIPGYGLQVRDPPGQPRAPPQPRGRSRSRSRSPPGQQGQQGQQGQPSRSHSRQHSSREEKSRGRSPSPKKSFRQQQPSGYTRKISPEELERKRQEMMENAKWREEERANNLRKHRREEELERELEKLDTRDGKFFHRLKLESASTSSLEDRVKRNIHSLQRTPAALEKNFMQR